MFPSFDFSATGLRTGKHSDDSGVDCQQVPARVDDNAGVNQKRTINESDSTQVHASATNSSTRLEIEDFDDNYETEQLLRVLPRHEKMKLVSISVQEFKGMSRYAVVMERV